MEIAEILKIQKQCLKRARKMAKRVYRTYDRIWIQRIRITPELEETGLASQINGRMPNLLLRGGEAPDIAETAAAYGFANGQALAQYLAGYKPRRHLEQQIYERLLVKYLFHASQAEWELARKISPSELGKVVKSCRERADELVAVAYAKYDEVWYGKIRITPELLKHGSEVVSELIEKMPNLLTHDSRYLAIDQVAMIYDFETSQELVDWLLEYKPRGGLKLQYCEELARQELGLPAPAAEMESDLADCVPF